MEGIDEREFIIKFKQEAEEHLQGLNNGLIEFEGSPQNLELVNELFRLAHTLKGAARMVGLSGIGDIAHEIENTFGKVRDEDAVLSKEEIDGLFRSFDEIKRLLDEAVKGESEEGDASSPTCSLQLEDKEVAGVEGLSAAKNPDEQQLIARTVPSSSARTEDKEYRPGGFGRRLEDRQETIRVRTERLDKLASLVSEMVIGHMQIEQEHEKLKEVHQHSKEGLRLLALLKERLRSFEEIPSAIKDDSLEELSKVQNGYLTMSNSLRQLYKTFAENISRVMGVTQDLQQEVMDVRMLPISIIFDGIPRAVRDIAHQFHKLIDVRISGQGTELDKRVLEGLRDPVIHLIRNAVDHGIETPEQRESLGKPREGMVEISARQEGEMVVVEISDDGAGIDWQEVRRRAAEKGFISPEVVDEIEEHDLVNLLFMPGFSTSRLITEISGRGVGLDVVKRKLEDLKGNVSISSKRGKGSTVRLDIPLTLAVQRVLLVKAGEEILALPTTSVEETLTIKTEAVRTIEGKQTVMVRERIVPLVGLAETLRLEEFPLHTSAKMLAVLVCWGNQRLAFVVDELVGEQEVVIKNLGSHLRRVRNVAGATILGNGEVIVILNVPDLIGSACSSPNTFTPPQQYEEVANGQHSILVVEDSLTTREMEKSILEAAGYDVEIAVDGVEALEKTGRKKYDLLLVDIQMPRMDGFQLAERLRSNQTYREVPIIMVTSLEKEEDKRRGIDTGANAYIVKKQFDQNLLLETVGRLIG